MKVFVINYDLKQENLKPSILTTALLAAKELQEVAEEQDLSVSSVNDRKLNTLEDIVKYLEEGISVYVDEENTPIYAMCNIAEVETDDSETIFNQIERADSASFDDYFCRTLSPNSDEEFYFSIDICSGREDVQFNCT